MNSKHKKWERERISRQKTKKKQVALVSRKNGNLILVASQTKRKE